MLYDDFLDEAELKQYIKSINSRAKALNKSGHITIVMLRDRIFESGGKCEWCTVSLVKQPFEVDHVISLTTGGGNDGDNLAVACPACNRAKASKHPAQFAQETYARTGIMTLLLKRVFDYYDIEASVQKSLFSTDDNTPTIAPLDNLDDSPPPYIWGQ